MSIYFTGLSSYYESLHYSVLIIIYTCSLSLYEYIYSHKYILMNI